MKRVVEYTETVPFPTGNKITVTADTPRDLRNLLWSIRNEVDSAIERVTIAMQPDEDEQ